MGKYLDSLGLSHLIGLIKTALSGKQATLVSGTNIKTINNESLLGSGNISVGGGGSGDYLPLTGGELTGELTVDTDITRGDTPSSIQYPVALVIGDTNGDQVGYIGAMQTTDGREGIHFGTSRDVNDSTLYESVRIDISSTGARSVSVDTPGAWQKGLGFWGGDKGSTSYWGLVDPDGSASGWTRTKAGGLLPAAKGGGSSSLGTSYWPFNNVYAENIYLGDSSIATKLDTITTTTGEVQLMSQNGLRRICLTGSNNVRVDTRASTSDSFATLYYPGSAPVSETTIATLLTQTSTQSTNNPITAASYYKHNAVAMLEIKFKPAAARSAGTAFDLCTLKSSYRPHLFASGGSQTNMARITTAGGIQVVPRVALSANVEYTIGFTYLL